MPDPDDLQRLHARNEAAIAKLEKQIADVVRRAVTAMLRAATAAVNGAAGNPNADDVRAAARSAWERALAKVITWLTGAVKRLAIDRLGNLPREDDKPQWRTVAMSRRRQVREMAQEYTRDASNRLKNVPDNVWDVVKHELDAGYRLNESPADLRDRVAGALGIDRWAPRASVIARTETTASWNAAQDASISIAEHELGEPLQRMWLATMDDRTRESHRAAHRQTVKSGERFTVGGAHLRYPGDPTGPAEEVISCRCTVVPVFADQPVDISDHLIEQERQAMEREFRGDTQTASADTTDMDALVALTRLPAQLVRYWTKGEGAAKIRWGEPKDFYRCERQLRKYVKKPNELAGLCANLHKIALGVSPGQEDKGRTADVGCPCETTEDDAAEIVAAVIGDDLPLAARDHPWDPEAAAQRVADWAAGDAEQENRGYFRRDGDEPAVGYADVVDGDLVAVPEAVFAAADALHAVEGDDAAALRERLTAWYAKMAREFGDDSMEPPWNRASHTAAFNVGSDPASGDQPAQTDTVDSPDASDDPAGDSMNKARQGAMVALVPSEQDAARLAVDGGIPADELHVTLAFLGDGADWSDEERQAVAQIVQQIASQAQPVDANAWAPSAFNPTGDSPCVTYLIGDNSGGLVDLHDAVMDALAGANMALPEQHSPWIPHVTAAYDSSDTSALDQTGPMTLDRLRVSFTSDTADYPLGGAATDTTDPAENEDSTMDDTNTPVTTASADADAEAVTAAVAVAEPDTDTAEKPDTETENDAETEGNTAPPVDPDVAAEATAYLRAKATDREAGPQTTLAAAAEAANIISSAIANAPERPDLSVFDKRNLTKPTPITVTPDGQLYGNIALWASCHRGIGGECVRPPRSRIDYAAFHQYDHAVSASTDGANPGVVKVGYLLAGCDHAPIDVSEDQARDYHEKACTRVAAVRAYEDDHGIQVAGHLMPGVTEQQVADLRHISGEWRTVSLELMAAVGVDDPGYPVAPLDATNVAVTASADVEVYSEGESRALALVAHIPLVDENGARSLDVKATAKELFAELKAEMAADKNRSDAIAAVTAAKRDAFVRKVRRYKEVRTG
ncbi:2'-5' RNA ligase family protein [Amycolatopsis sp. DSM 110486]|uniref:2'-5' RNA ligase family protein n=1 Tax=Amycolatopsis sp. DSM 110486 TaxID=2865832 RepID=UPI001C6A18A3|nr:2'-5' RNA ligase family protein [Amycolatopsis sp. DSM 110486]QYN17598.1 2'-5' RNA ligase family protein [Amycolatopsis sp. DSM 110486]